MSQEHQMSKATRLIRGIVLLVAIAGISAWGWKNFGPQPTPDPATSTEAIHDKSTDLTPEHTIVVTYFTSNVRCKTCLKIERLTHETLEKNFAHELSNKEIVFQTINFDKPKNKHYIKDYGLAFKTVVVSDNVNGKEVQWAKYDKVWNLVNTPEQFTSYLDEGIRQYILDKN